MLLFFRRLWESGWRNRLMLLFGAAVLLGAVVGVVYGIVTRAGDEGFLQDRGQPLVWAPSDLPLTCFHDDSVHSSHLTLYNRARRELQTRTEKDLVGPCVAWAAPSPFPRKPARGLLLLRVTAETTWGAPTSGLTVETPWTSHPGGQTWPFAYPDTPGRLFGAILHVDPAHASNYAVWLHELGHVLGLAHDRVRSSIMWPIIQERPGSLSDKDVKALQSVY